jgi:rSAM/selenodomain-associated transferase 2
MIPNDARQRPTLSVIIPALNEARSLPPLIEALACQQGIALEIVISDGGSSDGTVEVARAAGARVISAPRGRGSQMNAGARAARADYLLFLHADSSIDDPLLMYRAVSALRQAEATEGQRRVAGHFRLEFVRRTQRNHLAYRYAESKTALNRRYTTNGDQGCLLSSELFQALGGYDESLPFLEDQRLAEAIRADGLWITLPGVLKTSARRFETEGFHRRYFLMAIIMAMHYGNIREFFDLAPDVYRAQHDTDRLLLTPFFRILGRIMRERGWRGSLAGGLRVGAFVRENAWQAFFFIDVLARPLLGPERYPATTFHDRVLRPVLSFGPFDAVVAILVFACSMGILRPWFWCLEHRHTGTRAKQ